MTTAAAESVARKFEEAASRRYGSASGTWEQQPDEYRKHLTAIFVELLGPNGNLAVRYPGPRPGATHEFVHCTSTTQRVKDGPIEPCLLELGHYGDHRSPVAPLADAKNPDSSHLPLRDLLMEALDALEEVADWSAASTSFHCVGVHDFAGQTAASIRDALVRDARDRH